MPGSSAPEAAPGRPGSQGRAVGPARPVRRVPWPLAVPALAGIAFLVVPLLALVVRAPWSRLGPLLTAPEALDALRLSLLCATSATAASLLLGVPLAWVLARARWPGTTLVRAGVTVPLVLPPVVGGVALLEALGRNGVVGRWLESWFGVSLPFTTTGVVVAETFVAMPFLVVTVEGALRAGWGGYEEAARTLGARPLRVFWTVTLPLVRPALVAGAVLSWARALGEFGATVTFAGSYPGVTRTLPLQIYLQMQDDPDGAVAMALVLLVVSVAVLIGLRRRIGGVQQ